MCLSVDFLSHFSSLSDPRSSKYNQLHLFEDMLVITILGSICGADSWTEVCEFADAKYDWLKTFLLLPNGVPSHDTFGRLFSNLDSEVFESCFLNWVSSLGICLNEEVIAIDGKTLRGSRSDSKRPLHLVGAWSVKNNLLLGQVKTAEKSNEIEAIPRLLNMLDIKGCTVTIDAMGCQKKIAKSILEQEADYILALKSNQGTLYEDVVSIFKNGKEAKQYKKMLNRVRVEKVRSHGRIERRRYTLISPRENLNFFLRWPGLKSIAMVEITRNVKNNIERINRYFLTSIEHEDIDRFMNAQRNHWGIEINLHWSLDGVPQAHKVVIKGFITKCSKAIGKMMVGPSKSAVRSWFQTTPSGCH